jgi:hypothetical protein
LPGGRVGDIGYDIGMPRIGQMHQTTLRFGTDTWQLLEAESERLGISAAQYVRDAALARLAYTQGLEHGAMGRDAFAWAGNRIENVREQLGSTSEGTAALHAQGRMARTRARKLRADAERTRAQKRAEKNQKT